MPTNTQRDKYIMVSEALMACKGTVLALQDARTFTVSNPRPSQKTYPTSPV
jgi:hypothetical protein